MTSRTAAQSLTRVLIAVVAVLVFGLVVNHFESGEGWSMFDFALAQGLIGGAVLAYELGVRWPATVAAVVLSVGLAAMGGAAVIVGEVDDAPGMILIGMGLVATAAMIGFRSVRGARAAADAKS